MGTTNTYAFNPSLGEMVLYSYNLIGIRNTALVQEHMVTARTAANMLQTNWANRGVNLWAVDLQVVPLIEGQSTYNVPANTMVMLDAYISQDNNDCCCSTDRIILPISRSEYATYPNKCQEGFPTVFWFDRLLCPKVTIWPVPDGNSAQYLKYYRVRMLMDANLSATATTGSNLELPTRWLEAYADGLAERLARIWAKDRVAEAKMYADASYLVVSAQDVETAQQYISPQINGYYRP